MLNAAQERFCQEYLIDLNATRAYKAAYPTASDRSARAAGARLLADVSIAAEIKRLQAARAERVGVTADQVVEELTAIAFADVGEAFGEDGNLLPLKQLPQKLRRALSGVDVVETVSESAVIRTKKVRHWDKVKALELLGRHLGLWGDDNADRAPLQVSVLVHPSWAAAGPGKPAGPSTSRR